MILNYTNEQNKYISKYLAETSGDQVLEVSDILKDNKNKRLFSETPYILVADFCAICKLKVLAKMGSMNFEGSKILYVVFTDSQNQTALFNSFAKSMAGVKNCVLFGCDSLQTLSEGQTPSEEQILKVRSLASAFRDSVPFNSNENCNFPYRISKNEI